MRNNTKVRQQFGSKVTGFRYSTTAESVSISAAKLCTFLVKPLPVKQSSITPILNAARMALIGMLSLVISACGGIASTPEDDAPAPDTIVKPEITAGQGEPPIITAFSINGAVGSSNIDAVVGESVVMSVTAQDPDDVVGANQSLTYIWTQQNGPTVNFVAENTDSLEIIMSGIPDSAANVQFEVTAADIEGFEVSQSFLITVISNGSTTVDGFDNSFLRACVEGALARAGLFDLSDLSSLDCSTNQLKNCGINESCPIADLTGIEQLANLHTLNLSNNNVGILDLSPLSQLTKLTSLNLSNNLVGDISAFSDLLLLESLTLDNNLVRDLTPLLGLTQLTYLDVSQNPVADLLSLNLNGVTVEADLLIDRLVSSRTVGERESLTISYSVLAPLWDQAAVVQEWTVLDAAGTGFSSDAIIPNTSTDPRAQSIAFIVPDVSSQTTLTLGLTVTVDGEQVQQEVALIIEDNSFYLGLSDPALEACFMDSARVFGWTQIDEVTQLNCWLPYLNSLNPADLAGFKFINTVDLSNTSVESIAALTALTDSIGDSSITKLMVDFIPATDVIDTVKQLSALSSFSYKGGVLPADLSDLNLPQLSNLVLSVDESYDWLSFAGLNDNELFRMELYASNSVFNTELSNFDSLPLVGELEFYGAFTQSAEPSEADKSAFIDALNARRFQCEAVLGEGINCIVSLFNNGLISEDDIANTPIESSVNIIND